MANAKFGLQTTIYEKAALMKRDGHTPSNCFRRGRLEGILFVGREAGYGFKILVAEHIFHKKIDERLEAQWKHDIKASAS